MDRHRLGLWLLWSGTGAIGLTLGILMAAHGGLPDLVDVSFVVLALAAVAFGHARIPSGVLGLVALYLGWGWMWGLSHGYVLYAWPILLAGALVLWWSPAPSNPAAE